ncbi:hypothetical protein [Mastigocladopsis repens]|nr:hypothetical protein [Mastigocladopsis repens]
MGTSPYTAYSPAGTGLPEQLKPQMILATGQLLLLEPKAANFHQLLTS